MIPAVHLEPGGDGRARTLRWTAAVLRSISFSIVRRNAADFCLVNSLHDGMNLVAKEFVAARDERRKRVQLMRRTISEANVYRWAGRMLVDVARIRQRQALSLRTAA